MRTVVPVIAAAFVVGTVATEVLPQVQAAQGLDLRPYLSIRPGMTEAEVLTITGQPDSQADQGGPSIYSDRVVPATRTYTYLPTAENPYVTTITFVGGRVSDVRREKKS